MTFDKRKLTDLAFASPLIAFYGYSVVDHVRALRDLLRGLGPNGIDLLTAVQILSFFSSVCFGALLVGLLLLRMPPKGRAHGVLSRILAVIGTFAALGFNYLHPALLALPVAIFAASLLLLGILLTSYALIYLGRSFSIVPEARKLVTTGPYRFVRHPVYLFEEIAVFGMSLEYAAPASTLLLIVHAAVQFTRLRFEEQVLRENFPEYEAYAAHTARLIPGVY